MNSNVRQVLRANFTHFLSQGDGAFTQRRLWTACQPYPLCTLPITLSNLDRGRWSRLEENIVFVIRGFVGPGEPASDDSPELATMMKFIGFRLAVRAHSPEPRAEPA